MNVVIEVLEGRFSGDRGNDQKAEIAQQRNEPSEGVGRIRQDLAASAYTHRSAGEGPGGGGHQQERDRSQHQEIDIRGDRPEMPPQLESNDGGQHGFVTLQKYRSSRSGSTASSPGSGADSPYTRIRVFPITRR